MSNLKKNMVSGAAGGFCMGIVFIDWRIGVPLFLLGIILAHKADITAPPPPESK